MLLLEWWGENEAEAEVRGLDHALWLRARLTVDPAIAEADLGQIVGEFAGSDRAAAASLRLAQLADARGDRSGAEARLRELLREYPDNPVRVEARDLLESFAPEESQGSDEAGGRSGRRGSQASGRGRPPQVDRSPPVARHAVQLGTFQTASEAVALARRAIAAGFEARLVRIGRSQLVRVRVGLFVNPLDASRVLVEIRAAGFDGAAVENGDQEVAIGGGNR